MFSLVYEEWGYIIVLDISLSEELMTLNIDI